MPRAKFYPVPGLDTIVAHMIRDAVGEIADDVVDAAQRIAPPTKEWVSMNDGRVRRQHRMVHGDAVPANLRFTLTSYAWDVQHPTTGGSPIKRGDGSGWDGPMAQMVPGHHTYLNHPRDQSGGAYVAVVNCRCFVRVDQNGVAKLIHREGAVVTGTKVRAWAVAEGPLVVEAEYGDVYHAAIGELVADGTYYMGRAAASVAAKRQTVALTRFRRR